MSPSYPELATLPHRATTRPTTPAELKIENCFFKQIVMLKEVDKSKLARRAEMHTAELPPEVLESIIRNGPVVTDYARGPGAWPAGWTTLCGVRAPKS